MTTPCIARGTTVRFYSTFFDPSGNVVQPTGAAINIWYIEDGLVQQTLVEMTAPTGSSVVWTAQWDTREVAPGIVNWSVHSEGVFAPYAVGDGAFELTANNANLETF